MISIDAPAKINLFLHVTGKRADGYHTLQSLMVFTDTGDRLEIEAHDRFELSVKGPFAAALDGENLIATAAHKLAAHYSRQPHARITLTKNLPAAAGIGGGSSDAAAALKGLAQLWQLPHEPGVLIQIAQQLGADIPACLYGRALWAEGAGDKILPLEGVPMLHFVLVNPLIPTPTPQVFMNFRGGFSAPVAIPAKDWTGFLRECRNDLRDAAIIVTPAINDVLNALTATNCLLSRMSGSGATCFAIYDSRQAAENTAALLREKHPRWWIMPATMRG